MDRINRFGTLLLARFPSITTGLPARRLSPCRGHCSRNTRRELFLRSGVLSDGRSGIGVVERKTVRSFGAIARACHHERSPDVSWRKPMFSVTSVHSTTRAHQNDV